MFGEHEARHDDALSTDDDWLTLTDGATRRENSPAFHDDARLLSRRRISVLPLVGRLDVTYKLLQLVKQPVHVGMSCWQFIRVQLSH